MDSDTPLYDLLVKLADQVEEADEAVTGLLEDAAAKGAEAHRSFYNQISNSLHAALNRLHDAGEVALEMEGNG